ncbi:MAG: hypothetical protein AB4372_28905, partial [Xenococcus sp. (in: cyanobacteria)]
NLYMLFRIMNIEKDVERDKKFFLNFRQSEQETNKDFSARLTKIDTSLMKIEMYLSRFHTYEK